MPGSFLRIRTREMAGRILVGTFLLGEAERLTVGILFARAE
jgi:hypothetical protein